MKVNSDDITFTGQLTFLLTPRGIVSKLFQEDTPNIKGVSIAICCGLVITITNLLGGTDGQDLRLIGDGFTTIKNNTYLHTNTGADKLLSANKVYTFSYIDSLKQWFENA